MKKLLIALILLALVFGSACHKNDVKSDDWYPKSETLTIRFQSKQGGSRLQRLFRLPIEQEFEAECTIENSSAHTVDLCAVLFLDYRQVPFQWDNSARQTIHLFSLHEGQEESYVIRTPPLAEGYHEFVLSFFSHPFYHSSNRNWRRIAHMARWYWRANLYVGNAVLPSKEFSFYYQDTNSGCASLPVSIGTEPMIQDRPLWIEDKVEVNEWVDYFVTVRNVEEDQTAFALIYLLDYGQIPAHQGTDELVTFGRLTGSAQVDLPASFQVMQEGRHELMVLCIWEPYAKLENPPGTLAYPGHVDSSNRTLIVAEEMGRG